MNQDVFVLIEHLKGQVADISYALLAAGRVVAGQSGGEVVAVLLGHEVETLASNLAADRVLSVSDPALAEFSPDAYQRVLAQLLREKSPRAMLFGDTSIGADVAGWLSARLGLPLVSYCRSLLADDGSLKYVSQICGGKIMVEGDLPGPTVLVTMIPGGFKPEQGRSEQAPELVPVTAPDLAGLRVTLRQYIEPDTTDVDISKVPLLVAVGRGVQNEDDLEFARELAEALGGEICASRPIVDQGWLPTTRLVGKSGHRVSPKVYLAMGISGAPEHAESITDSELIIAINTDPAAPIFDIARYGVEVDMFDLLPVLTDLVDEARAG